MFSVLSVHPAQRDVMDTFLPWQDDTSDVMDSMMDVFDDWEDRNWMARPRRYLTRRPRSRPYDITPSWRSLSRFRPLLDDVPLLVVRSGDDSPSAKKNDQTAKSNSREAEKTQIDKNINSKTRNNISNKDPCKDADPRIDEKEEKSVAKPWQYSVDVGGCDEVRAFTEDGLLVVEGHGRDGNSSVMVRHVTTLPPHVKSDTLTATQKDGQLVLSHKCNINSPTVVNIPITNVDEEKTSKSQDGKKDKAEERQVESIADSSLEERNATSNAAT